ncbi:MAG TPA: polysaccharide deacetylase family protein [Solirubrobacterales bacterium]|nr:polysaccharide deacetylase family protein [Solirubrobacterales bacterium]
MSPVIGNRRRAVAVILSLATSVGLLWIDQASPATGPAGRALPPAAGADGGTPVGAGRQVLGCESRPGSVASAGGSNPRQVALTFDDGPSPIQTPEILAILDRFGARATFFEEGRHVYGREALMRQVLAGGDEIGNHSFDHPHDPGYGQLARADDYIRRATGFQPCLFRPPYGLLDPKVVAAARRAGLQIVLWSLDSHDDHHPGAAAIASRVVGRARPGSIVLMHDGGRHPQTVRALPSILRGLRRLGFGFVTVSELLGERMRYGR